MEATAAAAAARRADRDALTVWACWLVQHVLSVRSGGWQVESVQQQLRCSFAELHHFFQAMHARGDRLTIRDPLTKQILHRYKLPFKAMNVPPKPTHIFRWRRASAVPPDGGAAWTGAE